MKQNLGTIQRFQGLGHSIGRWINGYMKSYGTEWFHWGHPYVHSVWPRRWLVQMLGAILSEIDTNEFISWKGRERYEEEPNTNS